MSGPRFTVVVPSFQRRDALARALAAWERQQPDDLPFEVVVVDDGSTDGTDELLAATRPRRYDLRAVRQENRGPAAARNRALELASGELVLFAGDDIEPSPRLLAEHDQGHRRAGAAPLALVGRIDWPEKLRRTATMRHVAGRGAQQFSFHYMRDGDEYDFRHFYTSNVSIARRVLDLEPSHFSTAFPHAAFEDAELAFRLARHGLRIRYHAAALAWHWHEYGARGFFERQRKCGAMAQRLAELHPGTGRSIGVPALDRIRRRSFFVAKLGRGRLATLATELPERIERAIAAAERLDSGDDRKAEPLLLALFDYGYRSGLAAARYPADVARRVEASLYAATLATLERSVPET